MTHSQASAQQPSPSRESASFGNMPREKSRGSRRSSLALPKPQQEQPNTTDHGMVAGNTATLAAGLLSQCRFDLKDHNRQIVVECIAFREVDGLLIKQIHNFLSTSAPV